MNLYTFVVWVAYRRFLNQSGIVFTGGGAVGLFHVGVLRTLFNNGIFPKYITGSSVGSIVAAILACHSRKEVKQLLDHLHEKPLSFFEEKTFLEAIRCLRTRGYIYDGDRLIQLIRDLIGDITFEEAYQKTGHILNIPVCSKETGLCRFLNHHTTPDVVVWSAVAASTALPLFFPSRRLYRCRAGMIQTWGKEEWIDGSLIADIPIDYIRRQYAVRWFFLSLTNPLIIPLLRVKDWLGPKYGSQFENRCRWMAMKLYQRIPFGFGKTVLSMLQSEWESHFTFTIPIHRIWKFHRAILNHTPSDWNLAILEGSQASNRGIRTSFQNS